MNLFDGGVLLLLLVSAVFPVQASAGNRNTSRIPSAITLADCQRSCGDVTFNYPFGIGPSHCFRQPDFELICDNTTQPPRLLFKDGNTEINSFSDNGYLDITFSYTISMKSNISVYNVSWDAPGKSFPRGYAIINITGCDFDAYQVLDHEGNVHAKLCSVTCPNQGIIEAIARQGCNGTGCCSIYVPLDSYTLQLTFVSHGKRELNLDAHSLWNTINITTIHAGFSWSILDQPTCASALDNKTNDYACVSRHSRCMDDYSAPALGYTCLCDGGYQGNPYVLDGCLPDTGYNPFQWKENCTRKCGSIEVPYPFGLEEGCSARKIFQLNCTDMSSSSLQLNDQYQLTYINVSEGLMGILDTSNLMQGMYEMSILYIGSGESASALFAVANLTCQEAQQNKSGYACVSIKSACLAVNSKNGYIGYRCKCIPGFQGNPYVQDGCQDIDECKTPGNCRGVCHNTLGSYHCTACPGRTQYDATTMQCATTKRQNLILGIVIGLSCGFGVLLFSLSAMIFIRRWKSDIQKKLRKKHFRKNQGLLLEQLISSDENASDKTKFFSLDELEKATNNFDPTRILGRGGHGMVYKGILSDQRVVAIKRSNDIAEGEISQFINEVAILSQINHRNIVKLFGCCLETEVPLLVYDFITNGSLFDILHSGSSSAFSLSWDDCIRIAVEAAGALCYLHSAASISVFHRDVKSSNILLDANYTAKVSDFGASRLVPIDQTHVVTNVQGTFGYLDPEYYHTGHLNEKSDVYSFGVVLVELLLRRKPIITTMSGSKQSLSNYFLWELKVRPMKEIVADQVCEEATEEEINSVASLAEMCLRLRSEDRPTMKQVEMTLQFLKTKRLNSCHAPQKNGEEMQLFKQTRFEVSCQPMVINLGESANPEYGNGHKCYSLEQEFTSSIGLPR